MDVDEEKRNGRGDEVSFDIVTIGSWSCAVDLRLRKVRGG
jgi:hypothetical protein